MSENRGRPSAYRPILNRIRDISGHDWHPVRQGHANRTAPSALRKRYPGFDFRATPDGHGRYTIEARYLGQEAAFSSNGDTDA